MSQIVRSIHGNDLAGFDINNRLVVVNGYAAGKDGAQIAMPSGRSVAFFEDFLGGGQAFSTTIIDGWRSRKGSDGACVDWTITEAVNGTAVGTIGSTTASMAVSGTQLDRGLDWKANQGGVSVEARIKLSQITTIAAFFGFTDQVAALEMPIHSAASANTITTNATDACGFFFDTSMTDDTWWIAGVKADTDATHQNTTYAPVAATYEVLRVELDALGNATFFRNGVIVGTKMSNALTATVALTPIVAGFNRGTSGAPTITVDYLAVSGTRV